MLKTLTVAIANLRNFMLILSGLFMVYMSIRGGVVGWALVGTPVAALGGLGLVTKRPRPSSSHGSARWASADEVIQRGLMTAVGYIIGRAGGTKAAHVRISEPGSILTVAPNRTGKGVSAVIPNLLDHRGASLVIDPKAENFAVCRRQRQALGQAVAAIDPFGLTEQPSDTFNPLDWIRPNTADAVEDAATLAELLVYSDKPLTDNAAHFLETARSTLQTFMLYVWATAPDGDRSLSKAAELVDHVELDAILAKMATFTGVGGYVARGAAAILQLHERERSAVMSTLRRCIKWISMPRGADLVRSSSVSLDLLNDGSLSLFLCLPPEKMELYRGMLRLFVGLTLAHTTRHRGQREQPILMLLDEARQLGYMEPLSRAIGLVAGYGVTIWTIWQDMSQIRECYGEGAASFLANAVATQVFGVSDVKTAEYVSSALGKATVFSASYNEGQSHSNTTQHFPGIGGNSTTGTSSGVAANEKDRPLMTPDEIMAMPADQLILFVRGMRPILVRKANYLGDPEFAGLYDPNPMYH